MNRLTFILILIISLVGCSTSKKGTIAELRQVEIAIDAEDADGGLDNAIESYERFLETTEETPMTAEAIRRLADLKVEKEYGLITEEPNSDAGRDKLEPPEKLEQPEKKRRQAVSSTTDKTDAGVKKRTPVSGKRKKTTHSDDLPSDDDLIRSGAEEAVALYRKLLTEYPQYERGDQALYQLLRAHDEQGQVEEAMKVMNRFVAEYPDSRHIDEVQFRRAEYFFTRRNYIDAEKAYASVVAIGEKSDFYILALYKLGWSYYKQDLYGKALQEYFALLDYKAENGFNFKNIKEDQEGKRVQDTLWIISQSFSNLGGVRAVLDYFSSHGNRAYADVIYANLAEYYFSKQRYNDAVSTYATFIKRNRFHRQAPLFNLRVIEINKASGFPSLVINAKKAYAGSYAFGADYWKHYSPDNRPEVVAGLKTNLIDLANYFHARYRDKKFAEAKPENLKEALRWYREYLSSFPVAAESPAINYQLAELLLENSLFAAAAREFEKTAYQYPGFEKSDKAGYAAIYAYRQHLERVDGKKKKWVKRDLIRVSLKFAEFYPQHEKATAVLVAAVEDLYAQRDFKTALITSRHLIERYPTATTDIRRSALLVAAHSAYELKLYREAEVAYTEVLQLLSVDDKMRNDLTDNLAASIYKQGEAANLKHGYKQAADHFLKVSTVAPRSKLRPEADYDGAVALIKVEEWQGAATVLTGFRNNFPKHELQHEVTKKLAYIYREDGRLDLASVEFERIESESTDPELRLEALMTAAELYEQQNNLDQAKKVYRRYIKKYPQPVEGNIEARDKLATILKNQGMQGQYITELRQIVALEAKAGAGQTARTRHVAASAALILARPEYEEFISVRLVKPFKENLQRKQMLMKKVTAVYSQLFEYEVGDVTAAATFHLGEIYADFSSSLLNSQRPEGLSALELEEYELALEEQAYPFEEKAIEMHQSNLELLSRHIYNDWIDKSLEKLTVFMPARYAKTEVENNEIALLTEFRFENKSLSLTPQTDAMRAAERKDIQSKLNKEKPVAKARSLSVSRLEKGRVGFVISERSKYDINQRDLFVLGVDSLKSGEYDIAVDCFKSVTKVAPSQSAPYINLAIAYIRSDRDELAEPPLKKALELVAGHPLASHEYGLLLRRSGRFDEARAVYDNSLKLFPEYFPLHNNLGVMCDLYINDLKCASRQYEMLLKAQPGDEKVELWLAEVQVRQGR